MTPISKESASVNIAFKFVAQSDFEKFLTSIQSVGVEVAFQLELDNSNDIYNLNLPVVDSDATQQYILKLLFDDNFPEFVNDIKKLLNNITDKVDVNTAPTK